MPREMVRAVLRLIPADELGTTYSHEHSVSSSRLKITTGEVSRVPRPFAGRFDSAPIRGAVRQSRRGSAHGVDGQRAILEELRDITIATGWTGIARLHSEGLGGLSVSGYIQTITGKIRTDEFGPAHSHEHLVAHATPELVREDRDLALSEPEKVKPDIEAFQAAGGRAIVEMTTVDYGRNLLALQRLALDTGLQVVAATGFNKGKYCRPFTEGKNPDAIARALILEVEEGIGESGVKPGVVKAATSLNKILPWEEVALRAAARTHLATGCPISTHTEAGTMAEEQLAVFLEEGVAPESVIFGHMDRNPNLELHRRLAGKGAFISYDQVPKPKYNTEPVVLDLVVAMAKEGLHRQILIGGDFSRRSYFKGWGGSPGLDYLLRVFRRKLVERLEEAGLSGERIAYELFIENPRRAFAFRKG